MELMPRQNQQQERPKNVDRSIDIINFIRMNGPVVPSQIGKHIGSDMIIASAHLSNLAASKKLRISSLKMGGSPLYYLPGQEQQLLNFTKYMHEREREALEILKQEGIIRDREQTPVVRVAFRQIKDFAVPMEVTLKDGSTETFWRWYLIPEPEAESRIRKMLGYEDKEEKKEEPAEKQKGTVYPALQQPEQKQVIGIETVVKVQPRPLKEISLKDMNRPMPQDIWMERIASYFRKKEINIVSSNLVKKNTEAEFILELPSPLGPLTYFCKARSKRTCTEADLASALLQANRLQMPLVYITPAAVTEKLKKAISSGIGNIHLVHIGEEQAGQNGSKDKGDS